MLCWLIATLFCLAHGIGSAFVCAWDKREPSNLVVATSIIGITSNAAWSIVAAWMMVKQ